MDTGRHPRWCYFSGVDGDDNSDRYCRQMSYFLISRYLNHVKMRRNLVELKTAGTLAWPGGFCKKFGVDNTGKNKGCTR